MAAFTAKRVTGLEPAAFSLEGGQPGAQAIADEGAYVRHDPAPSYSAIFPTPEAHTDPDLVTVAAAWAGLPPALRAGILAMVKAAKPT
jgi:hypothetical protein